MLDNIEILNDETILWKQERTINYIRQLIILSIVTAVLMTPLPLVMYFISVEIIGHFLFFYLVFFICDGFIGIIYMWLILIARSSIKDGKYNFNELRDYKEVVILTNKRFIQRNMGILNETKIPKPKEGFGRIQRDIFYLNLRLVEEIMVYKYVPTHRIQFWLNGYSLITAPNMLEFRVKTEHYANLWNVIRSLFSLKNNKVEGSNVIEIYDSTYISKNKKID